MKPGSFTHTLVVLLSGGFLSASPVLGELPSGKLPFSGAGPLSDNAFAPMEGAKLFSPAAAPLQVARVTERFPWREQIVTTVFWIGEEPTDRTPVPNRSSSWDAHWAENYGGFDDPDPSRRSGYAPSKFTPKQNPFYCALPYNDKSNNGHRAEAPTVVPWFKSTYQGPSVSTCKGRWIAIRKGGRVAYAQWEDAGPFRTDHWQYVFGHDRPRPNLNKGAGLDVSPAVRDYLGMGETDVTDWRFVDFAEVPRGPWAKFGDNNSFVINDRRASRRSARRVGQQAVTR